MDQLYDVVRKEVNESHVSDYGDQVCDVLPIKSFHPTWPTLLPPPPPPPPHTLMQCVFDVPLHLYLGDICA